MLDIHDKIPLEPFSLTHSCQILPPSCELTATDHIKALISNEMRNINIYSIFEEKEHQCYCCYHDDDDDEEDADTLRSSTAQIAMLEIGVEQLDLIGSQTDREIRDMDKKDQGKSVLSPNSHSDQRIMTHSLCFQKRRVEATYRLRMSCWSYSICDFIGVSRYMVAIAFNYLDRFLAVEKFSW